MEIEPMGGLTEFVMNELMGGLAELWLNKSQLTGIAQV